MCRSVISTAALFAVFLVTAAVLATSARGDTIFVVNSTGDGSDTNPGDGACDADGGTVGDQCTLRAALEESNARSGQDLIYFDIPGAGPHTISPASALPVISDTLTLDATTEPDFAGSPVVELDGYGAGGDANGLRIAADRSTVRGLAISRFGQDGIRVQPGNENVIQGNYIGTDASGAVDLGNGGDGVRIAGGTANLIGGTNPEDRNIISGNGAHGIFIVGAVALTTGTVVQGNYIGTDPAGMSAVGNAGAGVGIQGSPSNIIGVNSAGEGVGNVISANTWGVDISGETAEQNLVQGNLIGVASDGVSPLGNIADGVILHEGANDNTTGGHLPSKENIIAHNGESGVAVGADAGVNNYIDPNQIHDNGGLGIDILEDGVTANDPNDVDSGPNDLQNFPVLTMAESGGGSTTVEGTLNSTPNRAYNLFFFYSPGCDPSGYGEGAAYLGQVVAVSDVGGNTPFSRTFHVPVPPGSFVTATASNPESTSEFSLCIEVAGAALSGDVDCDGDVDSVDALKVLRHVAALPAGQSDPCTPIGSIVGSAVFGDVDCDGDVDSVDALKVLRFVAGLPNSLPAGCPDIG